MRFWLQRDLAKYRRGEGKGEWPRAHLGARLGLHGGSGPRRGRFTDHAGRPLVSLLLRHMWIWPVERQKRIQWINSQAAMGSGVWGLVPVQFSSFQSLSRVWLFATPWIARPPCPSPTPRVHSDSRPWSQWCHPAISSSVVPFSSCPQFLPASESFPMRKSHRRIKTAQRVQTRHSI